MSKQEHEKDGQRAPSGASKGETPGEAAPKERRDTAKGKPDTSKPDTAGSRSETDAASKRTGSDAVGKSSDAAGKSSDATGKSSDATGKSTGAAKPSADARDSQSNQSAASHQQTQASTAQDKTRAKSSETSRAPGGTGGAGETPAGSNAGGGSTRGGAAGVIALVLALLLAVVLAVGGWWAWQKISAQQAQLAQLSRVESNANAIADLKSQLNAREQQDQQQREQALQKMRSEMQQYRKEVNQTLDEVLSELAKEQETDPSEWLFAEVEYLLRLANQRLQLERDVSGAIALLRTADERLTQADNPALTPVRRALQSELGELNSVPNVDRTGLYLTLMAQQEQLAQLPLEQDVAQIAVEGEDTSPLSGAWLKQLKHFGQELKELVVVRKHDQALEALITPEQEAYLRQNVRLQLEQSQLALLQANPDLYRASLEKAVTLVEGYYDTEHAGVQEVLEMLRSLAERTIRPELPDISGSLEALRNFMARRQDGGSADA